MRDRITSVRTDCADMLGEGEEILMENEAGDEDGYRLTERKVVDPDNVMEPQDGESLASLQTCTLADCKRRLIARGELVDRST